MDRPHGARIYWVYVESLRQRRRAGRRRRRPISAARAIASGLRPRGGPRAAPRRRPGRHRRRRGGNWVLLWRPGALPAGRADPGGGARRRRRSTGTVGGAVSAWPGPPAYLAFGGTMQDPHDGIPAAELDA